MKIIRLLVFSLFIFFITQLFFIWVIFYNWPRPTGHYSVGTKIFLWSEENLQKPDASGINKKENIIAQFWYPALALNYQKKAPYFFLVRSEKDYQDKRPLVFLFNSLSFLKTGSLIEAPLVKGRYPLIIFFHGYGGFHGQNTVLFEYLASRGYVVVSIDFRSLDKGVIDNFPAGVKIEEEVIRKIIERRLNFFYFLLRKIEELNREDGFFQGVIDRNRVGVIGHSIGGSTVMRVCRRAKAAASCINIDGEVLKEDLISYSQPLMILISTESGEKKEKEREFLTIISGLFRKQKNNSYFIRMKDAGHYDFTDLALIKQFYYRWVLSFLSGVGRIGGLEMIDQTNQLVYEFFELTLKKKTADYFKNKIFVNSALEVLDHHLSSF